jgi:hypothetical protein
MDSKGVDVQYVMSLLNEGLEPTPAPGTGAPGAPGAAAPGAAPGAARLGSRSQVFATLFGNRALPPLRKRFAAIKAIKAKLRPEVYVECMENILDSLRYEPNNV